MKSLGKGVLLGIGGAIGSCLCIAVAVVAFAGMGANSTASTGASSAAASSANKVGAVGERIVSGGIALTVLKVDQATSLSEFQQAEEGNQFVTVEVLIENVDRDETPYNPMYFALKDAEGIEYNTELYTSDGALHAGDIFKGDKVRGVVAFKTKADATDLVLSYEPLVLLGGYETIRVTLAQ